MPFGLFDQIVAVVVRLKNFVFTVALAISVLALLLVGYRYVVTPREGQSSHRLMLAVLAGIGVVLLASQLPILLRELLNR